MGKQRSQIFATGKRVYVVTPVTPPPPDTDGLIDDNNQNLVDNTSAELTED